MMSVRRFGVAAAIAASVLIAPTAPSAGATEPQVVPAVESSATRWSACTERTVPTAARCAWVRVPRDWARPKSSGTYRIRVARIPATGRSLGVLTFNPGGPGGAGIRIAGSVYNSLPEEIRRSFDLVAWDPRGVGRSEPTLRRCTWQPPTLPPTGPVNAAAVAQTWFDAVAEANQNCLRRNRNVANDLGTWQVVRDLDAIRKAVGARQISLWGMSYGTTIGRAYAQLYPHRLRALVLDGAIAPAPSIHSYMREHIWSDVTGVERMLAAFGGSYVKTYTRAMRYLERRTLTFANGFEMDRWTFVSSLSGASSAQGLWSEAITFLDDVHKALESARGRTAERARSIAASIESLQAPDPLSPQPRNDKEAFDFLLPLVNCADMPDRPSVQALSRAGEQAMGVGGTPYLLQVLGEGSQCAGLPKLGRALPGLHTVLRLSPRPVVINAVADKATPYLGARELANAFASAPMVVYDGTQHVAYGRTSSCIDAPVTRYLLTLRLPPRSTACPLNWSR